MTEFQVGQVWRMRSGRLVRIIKVNKFVAAYAARNWTLVSKASKP